MALRNVPSNRSLPSEIIHLILFDQFCILNSNFRIPQITLMFLDDKQFNFTCNNFLKIKLQFSIGLKCFHTSKTSTNLSICFFENILLIFHKMFVAFILPLPFRTGFFVGIGCCLVLEYSLLNTLKRLSHFESSNKRNQN